MISTFSSFTNAIDTQVRNLKNYGADVDPGHWQGVPTEGKPDLTTIELMDVAFKVPLRRHWQISDHPRYVDQWAVEIKPNLPWADDHFEERVGREPTNPGEQYKNWPWWHGQEQAFDFKSGADAYEKGPNRYVFSHTYQERFWPKRANSWGNLSDTHHREGIRYQYGDLDDVVGLLVREPHTRQAYLPIFFPEDTGAVHGGRIPCTLGYHFLLRNNQLHMWYEIRSCDAVRHFRDDIYLACRLLLWVLDECTTRFAHWKQLDPKTMSLRNGWKDVEPGIFTFHAYSFHAHKGDLHLL